MSGHPVASSEQPLCGNEVGSLGDPSALGGRQDCLIKGVFDPEIN